MQKDLMEGLNAEQRQAVEYIDGPLLVLAGAGTGKTKVITTRIAHLLSRGVRPERILAVTFTRKAASEMKERIGAILGYRPSQMTVSTFHSLGFKILREISRGSLVVFDEARQRELMSAIVKRGRFGLDPERALAQVSRAKNWGYSPEKVRSQATCPEEVEFAECFQAYENELRGNNGIDLDDMISCPVTYLENTRHARNVYQNRFQYILVDEYQDTNRPQYRLMRCLLGPHENLCVVGDDDQSIYGFRGADVERILRFREDFPRGEMVALQMNYRSYAEVISLANGIIAESERRYPKKLQPALGPGALVRWKQLGTENAEARAIAVEINAFADDGISFKDVAVLTRLHQDGKAIIQELDRLRIPFQRGKASGDQTNAVSLMTLHQSKGLEFPVVFMPALEDTTLPHFQAIEEGPVALEEERRLLYVGVTRAKQHLVLTASSSRGGRERSVSRFLSKFISGLRLD